MFKVPRFLLYWFAILAGTTGVAVGVILLIENWRKRSFDSDYALLSSSSDFFSWAVILLLSLMLLILVHIGHVLTGGLRFTEADKSVLPKAQSTDTPQTALKKSELSSPDAKPAPEDAPANQKLAHLVKPSNDKSRF